MESLSIFYVQHIITTKGYAPAIEQSECRMTKDINAKTFQLRT